MEMIMEKSLSLLMFSKKRKLTFINSAIQSIIYPKRIKTHSVKIDWINLLPLELWYEILKYITSPGDLRSLKLSCKFFKQHTYFTFDYSRLGYKAITSCCQRVYIEELTRLLSIKTVYSNIKLWLTSYFQAIMVSQSSTGEKQIMAYKLLFCAKENMMMLEFKLKTQKIYCIALAQRRNEIIRILLEDEFLHYSENIQFYLRLSCVRGCLEAVKILLRLPEVNLGRNNQYYLIVACRGKHRDIVEFFIKECSLDPSFPNQRPLITACTSGSEEIVSLLLSDSRVDPSVGNQQPLRTAIIEGHIETVKCLLKDNRVDPSISSGIIMPIYPAFLVVRHGRKDIGHLLLNDSRFDPCTHANYLLRWAIRHEYYDLIEGIKTNLLLRNQSLDCIELIIKNFEE